MRDEMIKGAIEQFMRSNPEPWRGHPETCKWHPRPNLVTVYRRAGFLWLRKVMGGNCTGCDWRVEGWQWTALTNWNNLASQGLLGDAEVQHNDGSAVCDHRYGIRDDGKLVCLQCGEQFDGGETDGG